MSKLYAFTIRHQDQIMSAAHVMADTATQARLKALAEYARGHTPSEIAKLRDGTPCGDAMADFVESHPRNVTCEARVSKASQYNVLIIA